MRIINTETLRWPMSQADVLAEEEAAGRIAIIGEGYTGHGPYRVVAQLPPPAYDPLTSRLVPVSPQPNEADEWSQGFEVRPLSADDIDAALAAEKARLIEAATAQRWVVETGGVTFSSGMHVGSTTEDQNRITTVIANAALAGVSTVDFKAAAGWVSLSLSELQGVAAGIALHVQACFSAERAHHEAIQALPTLGAARAYDVTDAWPGQQT